MSNLSNGSGAVFLQNVATLGGLSTVSNLVDRPGGLFFFKLSQKKRMSSFVKSVERLGGLSFFKLSHKGSVETNVKLCQICQALWGADFPSICRKKGPQARLTDLTNLTSHFPGPGKKCLTLSRAVQNLEGAPLGLLVLQHEIGHFDQQAALAAHHPDLLELSSHLSPGPGRL